MRFGCRGSVPLAASLLFAACVDQAYEVDPDSFLPGQDGPAQRRDGGPRSDGLLPNADRGVGSDVAVGNDRGLAVDQGGADLCVASTSCDVVFSYSKGSENSVELRGDFDNWGAGLPMTVQGGSWHEMVSDRLIVVLNRSDSPQSLTLGGLYKDLLSGATVNGATLSIGARSSLVLQ